MATTSKTTCNKSKWLRSARQPVANQHGYYQQDNKTIHAENRVDTTVWLLQCIAAIFIMNIFAKDFPNNNGLTRFTSNPNILLDNLYKGFIITYNNILAHFLRFTNTHAVVEFLLQGVSAPNYHSAYLILAHGDFLVRIETV